MFPWSRLVVAILVSTQAAAARGARADDLEVTVARMAKIGACWSPSFSPDASRLAFVSNLNGVPQVWSVPVEGGWPELVTALDDQVGSVLWSPDGAWLAFELAPGGGMNQQIYLVRPDGSDLHRITDGSQDNNWLGDWSHDSSMLTLASNRDAPETMDVYTYVLASRRMQLLARNPGIGYPTDLSRDAEKALVWRMESRSSNNLVLRHVDSGEETLLTAHEGPGTFSGGLFSPDASFIYLTSNKARDLTAFARIRNGTVGQPGAIEVIAARERDEVQSFTISEDGTTAALVWNVAGRSELEFQNLATLESEPGPELPAEIVSGLTFSRDGRHLAMVLSGSTAPSDIWILDRASGRLRQVTYSPHAGVDLGSLVRPELLRYRAHDGLELSGWLYSPPGVQEPTAYVLSFHGGPEGQERPSFRSNYQALLARGIGVFAPNVRGSSGFGKRFVNLDNGELRFDAIRDIESTVKYLVEGGIADPERIGIMGGSYGGYMTLVGLTWYPQLFAAGADFFGMVNFETFFEHTEPWMAAISTIEYGDPATQAALLQSLSPIHKLDQIRAPTIVLHGANDTNVPVVEAEQVVENLRQRDVPVEYVLFPDEGHGFRKTKNRITAAVATVRWFERHLGSGSQAAR
jgi:dipeptidyl aminopeptidase/acylaminoacyl peptidase